MAFLSGVYTIIPCFNEETTIATVVKDFHNQGLLNLILVDDGSSDNTLQIITQLADQHPQISVLSKSNGGQGSALMYGLDFLITNFNFDYVIFADADGQHSAADAKQLVYELHDSNKQIAHGIRLFDEATPYYKHLTNFLVSINYKLIWGKVVPDAACGLRAYTYNISKKINLSYGASYIVEANALEIDNWQKVIFIPISAIYTNYSLTKGLTWQGGLKIVLHMANLRFVKIKSNIFTATKKALRFA